MSMLGRPPHPGEPGGAPVPAEVTTYAWTNPDKGLIMGHAVRKPDGWKFIPLVFGHTTSRRTWPSPEACVPRWAKKPGFTLVAKPPG